MPLFCVQVVQKGIDMLVLACLLQPLHLLRRHPPTICKLVDLHVLLPVTLRWSPGCLSLVHRLRMGWSKLSSAFRHPLLERIDRGFHGCVCVRDERRCRPLTFEHAGRDRHSDTGDKRVVDTRLRGPRPPGGWPEEHERQSLLSNEARLGKTRHT